MTMNLNLTEANISTLVDVRPLQTADCLFVTISPSPTAKVNAHRLVNGRKVRYQCAYSTLPQSQQYNYCVDVVRKAYLPLVDDDCVIVGTYELNDKGNVHLHMILHTRDICQKYPLDLLRRSVADHPLSFASRKNLNHTDYMNNIVTIPKCDHKEDIKSETTEKCVHTVLRYMMKDEHQRELVKTKIPNYNFYVKPVSKSQEVVDLQNLLETMNESTLEVVATALNKSKNQKRRERRYPRDETEKNII